MRQPSTLWTFVSTALLWVGALGPSAGVAAGPADFSGVWQAERYQRTLAPSASRTLPLTPEGRMQYQASATAADRARDLCLPQGIPRAMTTAYPLRIVQTGDQLSMILEENRVQRVVRLNAEHADPAVWDPSFMGESVGRWRGNHLEISTSNFKPSFLDDARLPHSSELQVLENLSLTDAGATLIDEITITDPLIYTKPWKARLRFRKRNDLEAEPIEWVCGEAHRAIDEVRDIRSAPEDHPSHEKSRAPLFHRTLVRGDELTAGRVQLQGFWFSRAVPNAQNPTRGGPTIQERRQALEREWEPRLVGHWREVFDDYEARVAKSPDRALPTPDSTCLPFLMPGNPSFGFTHQIILTPDLVVMLFMSDHQSRLIYMKGDHPTNSPPTFSGHSIGRWEGDTLVIDTVGYNHRSGFIDGVPHSDKLHVVERYMVSPDSKTLNVVTTYDDPEALNGTYSATQHLQRDTYYQEFVNGEDNRDYPCPNRKSGGIYQPLQ